VGGAATNALSRAASAMLGSAQGRTIDAGGCDCPLKSAYALPLVLASFGGTSQFWFVLSDSVCAGMSTSRHGRGCGKEGGGTV
jgi:hypothetical protein